MAVMAGRPKSRRSRLSRDPNWARSLASPGPVGSGGYGLQRESRAEASGSAAGLLTRGRRGGRDLVRVTPSTPMHAPRTRRSVKPWGAALLLGAIVMPSCDRSATSPGRPAASASTSGASATGASNRPSAAEMLTRMSARYAGATTYRDQGRFEVADVARKATPPLLSGSFTTVCDRKNGLRWQVDQTSTEGTDAGTVIVSSRDLTRFDWPWTLSGESGDGVTAWQAFKASLGNTANTAGVVPALLLPKEDLKHVRFDPTLLRGIADLGDEVVGGAKCTVIDADGWHSQRVRLWIDGTAAIVKLRATRVIPAAFDIPASTIETTIYYEPQFDGAIPKSAFAHAKSPDPPGNGLEGSPAKAP